MMAANKGPKPGEYVRITIEQVDIDDHIISKESWDAYGFDNPTANLMHREFIAMMLKYSEELDLRKNPQKRRVQ